MRIIEPLLPGNIYHIHNQGINSGDIFKEERNYYYFLDKYHEYCSDILETYAYSLLKNHFHLMVKIKEHIVVQRRDGKGEMELNASKQLSHFFNCYAQSYNAAYNRHGSLLEQPFRRVKINEQDFRSLICYIHMNPQLHKYVHDFRDWKFTSWDAIQNNSESFLAKEKVISWFGSIQNFKDAHLSQLPLKNLQHLLIE